MNTESNIGQEGKSSPAVDDASASRREPASLPSPPGDAGSILSLDTSAIDARKPRAGPLVDPAEAIAIGLSIVPSMGKKLFNPEGPEVRQVLLALKLAGWEIVPR